jgi:pilus assembly protein FimV
MMCARNLGRLMLLASLAGAATLLSPVPAWSLGLGDLHLKSSLDAPLSADIDLVDTNAEDLSSLKATLAPREMFMRLGADYPSFLGTVTLTPEKAADGHTILHVTSSGVADEPFATLLVQVDWPRGHLVREYTVLLDPPVFNSKTPVNANVAAPSVGGGAHSGSIQRGAAAVAAAGSVAGNTVAAPPPAGATDSAQSASANTAAQRAAGAAAAAGNVPGTYTVQRGDTLSSIAGQEYGSGDRRMRERELVAIYRANPQAFEHNMNVLLAGRVLKLPGDAEVAAISPGEASTEVRDQYQAWRSGHGGGEASAASAAGPGGGQLRLVAPQEGSQAADQQAQGAGSGGGAAAGTGAGGSAALQQRVQQLQTQLAQTQRLLQLSNAQLAQMQARLAQQNGAHPGTAATAAAGAAAPATPAQSAATPTPAPATAVSSPAPSPTAVAAPAAKTAAASAGKSAAHKPAAAHKAAGAQSGGSVLDLLTQYWYVAAGVIVILIALLVMRALRARREDAFDQSLGRLSTPDLEPVATSRPRNETVPVRTMTAVHEEPSYSVEESGAHEQPVFEQPASLAESTGQHVVVDEGSMTGEVPVALDQGDPLAEADFHMAYGLYDQAAELVQNAITREPQRRDLKLKLLEVFFVWGNKDRFLQSAHELAATRAEAPAGEWEKIVIMGRQIAPEDTLFADGRGLAGAASGGVDLNLEGGQNRVDFDLLGEPSIAAAGHDGGVDLDLGSALGQGRPGDADATGEANNLGDGVDFVLEEGQRSDEATGSTRNMAGNATASTREMPAAPAAGWNDGTGTVRIAEAGEADAPTVEELQLDRGEHHTIREKLDAASRHGLLNAEQTAELEIDDLGLDLGSLDASPAQARAEQAAQRPVADEANAPTMLAGLDEDTRALLERTEAEHSAAGGATGDGSQRRGGNGGREEAAASEPAANGTMRATGTWLFTDTDFASMTPVRPPAQARPSAAEAPTQIVTQITAQPPIDTSSTSRLATLDPSAVDLDLGALGNGYEAVDLDVGAAGDANGNGTYIQTRRLPAAQPQADDAQGAPEADAADGGLPDLEPVTLSEVGTKLDLARAYMDMGDPDGARSILSEVLSEGSLSQKQEARRLMEALPG